MTKKSRASYMSRCGCHQVDNRRAACNPKIQKGCKRQLHKLTCYKSLVLILVLIISLTKLLIVFRSEIKLLDNNNSMDKLRCNLLR